METIKEIEESLAPPPEPQRKPREATKPSVDLAEALLKLPEVAKKLDALLQEKKREVDALAVLQDLDLTVQKMLLASESNLKQTVDLKDYMVRRLKALDSLEAKWDLLIQRVNGVLGELERVLKHL